MAVTDFRGAQELRADLRSYQGWQAGTSDIQIYCPIVCLNIDILPGLVRAYLALAKCKDALFTAREAMKVMHQSAKALKLVSDVHTISSSGRETVNFVLPWVIDLQTICSVFLEASSAQLDRCV